MAGVWTSNELITGNQVLARMLNEEAVLMEPPDNIANTSTTSTSKTTVGGAQIIKGNLLAENGVVFVIDQVVSRKQRSNNVKDLKLGELVDQQTSAH